MAKATFDTRGVPPEGGAPQEDSGAKPPPKFGTPIQAAPGGDLPRVCKELERAPKGVTRFKVRAANYPSHKTLYVLAKDKGDAPDEDAAKTCYLAASGLGSHVAKLKTATSTPDDPMLVVTVLAD